MSAVVFLAWVEGTCTRQVTREQMAAGLMASAAALGKGTSAAGVLERQALEVARGGTAGYTTVAALDEMQAARRAA